jgi:hypothetical protein
LQRPGLRHFTIRKTTVKLYTTNNDGGGRRPGLFAVCIRKPMIINEWRLWWRLVEARPPLVSIAKTIKNTNR